MDDSDDTILNHYIFHIYSVKRMITTERKMDMIKYLSSTIKFSE